MTTTGIAVSGRAVRRGPELVARPRHQADRYRCLREDMSYESMERVRVLLLHTADEAARWLGVPWPWSPKVTSACSPGTGDESSDSVGSDQLAARCTTGSCTRCGLRNADAPRRCVTRRPGPVRVARSSRLARHGAVGVDRLDLADLGGVRPPLRDRHQAGIHHLQSFEALADLLEASQVVGNGSAFR